MRTFAKTLEALLLAGLVGSLIYLGLVPVARHIGDSLNQSAEMVADPAAWAEAHQH